MGFIELFIFVESFQYFGFRRETKNLSTDLLAPLIKHSAGIGSEVIHVTTNESIADCP